MTKPRKHIFIHPDHIENLDETNKKLEKNQHEAQATGYTSLCRVRNYHYNGGGPSDILFTREFIEKKMPTRAFIIFNEVRRGRHGRPEHTGNVMLQPARQEWMNRTHINHVHSRFFTLFRRFRYRAELDSTPPSQIFYEYGISVTAKHYLFRLQEFRIRDRFDGDTFAYRLIPISDTNSNTVKDTDNTANNTADEEAQS